MAQVPLGAPRRHRSGRHAIISLAFGGGRLDAIRAPAPPARPRLWLVVLARRRLCEHASSRRSSRTVRRPRYRVRAGTERPRAALRRPSDGAFTVVFEVPSPATRRSSRGCSARRPRRAAVPSGAPRAQLVAGRARRLRRRRLDADARPGEGLHRRGAARRSGAPGRRARLRHGRRRRSSTTSTRSSTPTCATASSRSRFRRAPRAARRLRPLGGGDDPARLRRAARSWARSGSSTASRTSPRRRPTRRTSCS